MTNPTISPVIAMQLALLALLFITPIVHAAIDSECHLSLGPRTTTDIIQRVCSALSNAGGSRPLKNGVPMPTPMLSTTACVANRSSLTM